MSRINLKKMHLLGVDLQRRAYYGEVERLVKKKGISWYEAAGRIGYHWSNADPSFKPLHIEDSGLNQLNQIGQSFDHPDTQFLIASKEIDTDGDEYFCSNEYRPDDIEWKSPLGYTATWRRKER